MIRNAVRLLLLMSLLAPIPMEAQNRGDSRSGGSDEQRVFIGTFQAIRDYSLSTPNDSLLWEMAIEGLIKELDDPYALVLSPREVEEFQEETTGNYAGIGVQITELNEEITITAVFRGTPAQQAGMMVGDRIVGVDEDSADEWTVGEASNRIRGEAGTTVEVFVRRDGIDDPIRLPITRAEVHIPSVVADVIFDDIGYVHLDRVARGSAAEVDSVLTELRDTRGIILDLRRNPGGYLDESLDMADLFLDPGLVMVRTKNRDPRGSAGSAPREESGVARSEPRLPGKPIIVLVDRFTASAAEIVAGALQDHDRALVIGERTFGKGLVQTVIPLPEGRQLRLTTGEWFTPLGRSLHRPRDRDGRLIPDVAQENGGAQIEPGELPDSRDPENQGVEEWEEDEDELPRFYSASGRELLGGGGVFPDLKIDADSLTESEQELLRAAAREEVLLMLRISELAFESAQRASAGGPADVPDDVFQAFLDSLIEEGLPPEVLEHQDARDYLRWRVRWAMFERMEDTEGRAAEVRSERDPVLSEAVRLIDQAGTVTDLFTLAGSEPGQNRQSSPPGS